MSRCFKTLCTVAALFCCTGLATVAWASAPLTLGETQTLFPQFPNMANMNGFQEPCVDGGGTMVINAFVGDITQFDIAVAMVCQVVGYPAFCPAGPVTFSSAQATLLGISSVPGHPDAFALEFIARAGLQSIQITIQNTCWPQGCVTLLDFAGYVPLQVPTDTSSWGAVKALY
jgi:hypothetical protein